MNFCTCCWLEGSISDGQVGQWWSSMARRLSFLSLESTFKLLAQKASLLRKTGKASAMLLPISMMSIFNKSASKRASSVKMGSRNQDLGCRRSRVLIEPRTELCFEPPATTVLSRKGGRSGRFQFWMQRFDFRRRFFWLLLSYGNSTQKTQNTNAACSHQHWESGKPTDFSRAHQQTKIKVSGLNISTYHHNHCC